MADDNRSRRDRAYAGSPAGYGGGGFGEHGYGGGLRGAAERGVSGPVRGERDRPEGIGGNGYAGDRTDGPHRGKGPRGYRRSDPRILEDVSDRLMDDPHVDARSIEVRVEDGEVTLDGTVGSRWEKRRAEDLAETVSGVAHVQNNLRVRENTAFGKETMTPERQPDGGHGSPVTGRSRPR
ncbi:MAG TPA: BON domain-containing protein [Salinarimonas sp.]|nr:BON domain-containing protein [Salinarimonas sp.]